MRVFEASDIIEIAIRIEENGVNFYKFAEQIAKQEAVFVVPCDGVISAFGQCLNK